MNRDIFAIGLDVGTGSVKVVSDSNSLNFPSIYAYRSSTSWEKTVGVIKTVGETAVEMKGHPDAVIIRPVGEGKPIHHEGFGELVKFAVESISKDASFSKLIIVIGLPYLADKKQRSQLSELVTKITGAYRVVVLPQVIGTLRHMKMSDGIVVSIGQGTTEIVVFENEKPIHGTSIPQATDFLTQSFGEFAHLDHSIFLKKEVRDKVDKLADIISNRITLLQGQLDRPFPLILSGGAVHIPGMVKSLKKKINADIVIPDDPVMSNANGLFNIASE